MVWCGYDPKMGDGIREFGNGLAESIRRKAKQSGSALPAQIANEQDDLYLLEKLLQDKLASTDASSPLAIQSRAILGLVSLSRFLIGTDQLQPAEYKEFLDSVETRSSAAASQIEELDAHFETLADSGLSHLAKLSASLVKAGIV